MAATCTLKSVCMVLVAAVLLANVAEAGISCSTVVSSLAPCISYAQGKPMDPKCCPGVKALNGMAKTTPDRQAVCRCLESLAGSVSGVNYAKAAGLPAKCGVTLPYKIDPKTDCSKVK